MTSIYSWNVNGIRAVARKNSIQPFIKEHSPDILNIQETKAEQHQSEIKFDEYKEFWYSAEKKGYSGTAIFSKASPLTVKNGLPKDIVREFKVTGDVYGDPNLEGRIIAAEFKDFYAVSVYTPNAKDNLTRVDMRHHHWDPAFLAYMKQLDKKKPVVISGDLNVAHTPDDLARPKENEGKKGYTAEERQGFQNIIDNGFIDSFRLFHKGNGYYTWWTQWANARQRNVGWRIDYILVSQRLAKKITAAEIHPKVMGSDHCPISITLDFDLT